MRVFLDEHGPDSSAELGSALSASCAAVIQQVLKIEAMLHSLRIGMNSDWAVAEAEEVLRFSE